MPKLSGIFKSSEKNINQVGSEISHENIRTISTDNIIKGEKGLLSDLIPLAKSKKSSTCFQLHSYDNVHIRRVINPIKEEEPKLERRKSLKNEIFKNLRINTFISGFKGSLNSAPIKDDNNKKNFLKGPKTASVDKIKSDNEDSGHSISNNSDQFILLNDNDIEKIPNANQSLNTLNEESIKSIDKKKAEDSDTNTNTSTPSLSHSNNTSLSVIDEKDSNESSSELDRNMSFHSDNDLPKKPKKVGLTIDTSQPKEKKLKKLTSMLTPSSKSLPWLKEKKKNKKSEASSPTATTAPENKEYIINYPMNNTHNKSKSVPNSENNLNAIVNSVSLGSGLRNLERGESGGFLTTPMTATPTPVSTDSPSKNSKKKKIYFTKNGMVIGKVEATDIRIVPKLFNEYKEDFHKRVELDFVCSEARKNQPYNNYFYNPTDLIYNNSKAFFFYEPTISIGSLKDILKNSKGFKDEMDIYVEEMLCTFKKLIQAVYWLHTTYQVVHRRIEPDKILFDNSGQFKLTGLEWAFRMDNNDVINVQQEYNYHESLIHTYNSYEKNEPIFFAPEVCQLDSDYFSKISSKIDVYSCGMILAAMNFGYSNVSLITAEHEQQKKYSLNNNFSDKENVLLMKNGHLLPEIIQLMLKWRPYERIPMKEIIATEWFKNINVCTTSNENVSLLDIHNKSKDEIIHTHLNIPGQKCKEITF